MFLPVVNLSWLPSIASFQLVASFHFLPPKKLKERITTTTLPETNLSSENPLLETEIPFGMACFTGKMLVLGSVEVVISTQLRCFSKNVSDISPRVFPRQLESLMIFLVRWKRCNVDGKLSCNSGWKRTSYIHKHLVEFATCKGFSEVDEEEENDDEDSSLLDRKNGSWRSS